MTVFDLSKAACPPPTSPPVSRNHGEAAVATLLLPSSPLRSPIPLVLSRPDSRPASHLPLPLTLGFIFLSPRRSLEDECYTRRTAKLFAMMKICLADSGAQFGVVLAVSKLDSPRRDGLLWAANLTRLDITIAEQPEWTEEDLQKFRPENGGRATKGSVMAWLGHLHSLKWCAIF